MPDIVVIGAGMAGASAAHFLARRFDVLLLEREDQPGYHTTGRSAALYTQAYGNAAIRALTVASKPFFDAPPDGFSEVPLLTPRGLVLFGRPDQSESLDGAFRDGRRFVPEIRMLDSEEACRLIPAFRPDYVAGGVYEPKAADIDVHAMHRGFLRGVPLRRNAEVEGLDRRPGGGWRVALRGGGEVEARIVVNAAGAWADELGTLAGAAPVGLVPKRRTAFTFPAETGEWPMAVDVDEQFYFKPESGRALGSLADETPSPPCDAQPEEIDVAMAVDRIERATSFSIRRIERRWAGLRSFVADKTLVAGFDPDVPGFFWCAGQGGYGIQTAPAMGRAVASLAAGDGWPAELDDLGLRESVLSPARFRGGAS
ncbi:MAG: FAD-binding oxidoreductase [Alphaproteobacteria bacterium]|nr:FAD-binding oxidoreductase [Alphaproteobacteria bacterium]